MAEEKKAKGKAKKAKRRKKLRMLPLSRPATPQTIIDRARQYGPACVDALADVAANGSDASRVSAASTLLDRGFGKVGQPIELTGADGGPVPLELGISPAIAAGLQLIKEAISE